MTREDIEKEAYDFCVWADSNASKATEFALNMVRRHNEECAEIVNAARYESVDLRSLVSRISGIKP